MIEKRKRGRPKGSIGTGGKKKEQRTDIKLKSIALDPNKHFGPQLKAYRKIMNISYEIMGHRMGCDPSNVNHFENPNGKNKFNGSLTFVYRYAKALGAKEVKLKL